MTFRSVSAAKNYDAITKDLTLRGSYGVPDKLGAEDLSLPSPAIIPELGTNPSLEEMEKTYILRVLKEANGNQSKASQLLGIDRKTLYLKLKKYGIGS